MRTEFTREFIKSDPMLQKFLDRIIQIHKVPNHTKKALQENMHTKNFCVQSRHWAKCGDIKPLFIHYDTSSWYKHPNQVTVKIDTICIYDSHYDYEVARLKAVHSTKHSEGANLN